MTAKLNNTLAKLTLSFLLLLVLRLAAFSQAPVAAFTANSTSGCSPLTVQFTDQSTGNPFSWNWDFGNGQLSNVRNPLATYSIPGTYTVRLVVRNSTGLDEEIKTNYITVYPSPAASFTSNITTACVPATIQFTDQSTTPPGAGTITSWLWDFGDGTTSTQPNPSHTYNTVGFYTVSLRITSSTGCQSFTSIGRYIRIVNGIAADFTFTQPGTCRPPFDISFQDQSSGPGTLTYSWNFGNGGPGSTLPNPTSSYPATGTFPVTLNVQSSLGCSGSITKNIQVTGKTTDFNFPSQICIGQSVNFQNNSNPPPVSSYWEFSDGTTSSQINPTKTFLTGGTFNVKLVNNYGNCSDSITKSVTVITQPSVNFSVNDSTACRTPFAVQFTDSSPSAATWLWNFGDGTTSNQQNPSHTYNSSGTFNVTLTITLPGGCSNTITKNQLIKIGGTSLDILNSPVGGCIPFTYSPIPIIQSIDSIISYSWNLGEPGAIYNTQTPTHTYNNAGNYNISLTVTTQTGCTETLTINDGVRTGTRPTVNFNFTPNNVCASTPVQFTDLSVTTPGAFVQWNWDFGDSLTSNQQNPSHVYEDTGTLTVKLIVSNNGCIDSAFRTITIIPPVAKFGYRVDCNNPLNVTFLDSSLVNPVYGVVTYEWRMGDPANTVFFGLPPPTFTYPVLGTYNATLIVTNGPCIYQKTEEIILADEPASFTIDRNPICKGGVFNLSATGSDSARIKDYTWTIGSVTIPDTSRTISYSLFAYGTYDVTLLTEDVNGCFNSLTIPNFINISGPLASFTPNGPGGCVNSIITFTDQTTPAGSPITQWTWNFGDGTQQVYSNPPFTHTYAETGIYTVSLMIKDNVNCRDTFTIPNAVFITRPIAAFMADTFYCPLSPLQFTDTSTGNGLTHYWEFGDGGTSTLQNPTHQYPAGNNTYSVKLKIRDQAGCEDSVYKQAYIDIRSPQAAFTIQDTTGICLPLQTTFTFQGSDYETFYWDFGDGSTNNSLNPSHFYNNYGTYQPKLYVIGPGGCSDSAASTVTVYDPANSTQIIATPNTACNSLTVTFDLVTPPGFEFSFNFGDGTIDSSQQSTLTHFYKSPGIYRPYVRLVDRFGCESFIAISSPINVYGALPLFDKSQEEFCDNGEVFFINYTLNNDPIISTTWDFGDGSTSNASDPSHIYSVPGTYIVSLTVVTQNQCTSTTNDTIRVYKTPELLIAGRDTVCVNTPETFTGVLTLPDSTIQWQWTLGNGSTSASQDASTTYSSTGDYNLLLIATNKLGCADTAGHSINVVPLPTATPVTNPVTIISGGSTSLNFNYTGQHLSYNWTPSLNLDCTNCPTPVANPQFSTTYTVEVMDNYGCINRGDITVQVVCTGQNFFVPNTFSPNGDGSNDVFYLRGSGLFRVKSLRIFNRWGEVVFDKREVQVNSPSGGWDGMYKNKVASPGVYVYQLEILCNNGEIVNYSGNIALIR